MNDMETSLHDSSVSLFGRNQIVLDIIWIVNNTEKTRKMRQKPSMHKPIFQQF